MGRGPSVVSGKPTRPPLVWGEREGSKLNSIFPCHVLGRETNRKPSTLGSGGTFVFELILEKSPFFKTRPTQIGTKVELPTQREAARGSPSTDILIYRALPTLDNWIP